LLLVGLTLDAVLPYQEKGLRLVRWEMFSENWPIDDLTRAVGACGERRCSISRRELRVCTVSLKAVGIVIAGG